MKKRNLIFLLLFVLFLSFLSFIYLAFFYPQKKVIKRELSLLSLKEVPVFKGSPSSFQLSKENLFLTAQSAYAIDLETMTVLYEKNAAEKLFPASTTKMMTALIARETFDLDEELVASDSTVSGNRLFLENGEKMKVRDLLAALLLVSANDVAYLLAENDPGGYQEFLRKMDEKASYLHLDKSSFINPAGFDEEGQSSSANDLVLLAKELLKDEFLKNLVSTEYKSITSESGEDYPLYNTNQLLGKINGVKGVKTGTTDLAGEVLVTLIERDGHQIIISLMKSEDRYLDTNNLISWILNNYNWENLDYESQLLEGF